MDKQRKCRECGADFKRWNKSKSTCKDCFKGGEVVSLEQAKRDRDAATLESAGRVARNEATNEDRLRRDNAHLAESLSKARGVIKAFEGRATVEDRAVSEIMAFLADNPYRPQLAPAPKRKAVTPGDHEMVAVISDAHFPEKVDPLATFGLTYGADICKARMSYLRDKIIRYVDIRRKASPVRKVTLAVLGDMLSGDIHEELEVTNEMPMAEALTSMAYMLLDLGAAVAAEVEDVEMIVMPGNHPRIQKKPRFKDKWNNWEVVMGQFVAGLARDKFAVTVPKDIVYRHRVFDRVIGMTHGDGVKSNSFAGIPFYGIKQRREALQSLLRMTRSEQLDMLIYGHWHQLLYEEGQGCSVVINGSIKGGDEYSVGTRYSAQSPVQAVLTFHQRHGLTDLSRINLGHINAA